MKKVLKTIIFDIFYLLIGAYISLMFLEYFKPGLVSNYLDLNKILYFLIPLAVLCVLIGNQKTKSKLSEESDLTDQIK